MQTDTMYTHARPPLAERTSLKAPNLQSAAAYPQSTIEAVRSWSKTCCSVIQVLSCLTTAVWLKSYACDDSLGHGVIRKTYFAVSGAPASLLTCKQKSKSEIQFRNKTPATQHPPHNFSPIFSRRRIFCPPAFAKLTFARHCSTLAFDLSASSCRLQTQLLLIFLPSAIPSVSSPCFSSSFMLPWPSRSLLLTESSRLWKVASGNVSRACCACISSRTFGMRQERKRRLIFKKKCSWIIYNLCIFIYISAVSFS